MSDDIYQKLAEHLDTHPQRYPTNTGTGLETKILAHIFSPESTNTWPRRFWWAKTE